MRNWGGGSQNCPSQSDVIKAFFEFTWQHKKQRLPEFSYILGYCFPCMYVKGLRMGVKVSQDFQHGC